MAILHCGIGTFTWVKNLLKRTKIQDIVTFNRSLWKDYLMLIETKRGFSDISMWSASLKIKKGKILFYSFFVTFTNFGVKHMICVILLGLFSVCWETWRKRRHQAGACWQIRWAPVHFLGVRSNLSQCNRSLTLILLVGGWGGIIKPTNNDLTIPELQTWRIITGTIR